MFLQRLYIKNFRGITELSLDLDEMTVLIGGNNTGKSTILDAIQFCLNRSLHRKGGVFGEYDYHLKDKDGQPTDSEPIEITLTFAEQREHDWPDEVVQLLDKAVSLEGSGLHSIKLRVTGTYDDVTEGFVTKTEFLNPKDQVLPVKQYESVRNLQSLVPTFYLAALRDAAREFRPGSALWAPFVRALKIDPALRNQIEADLGALNKQVLDAHTTFDAVRERLGKAAKMVPLGGGAVPVIIEAIPGRVFDILSKTQVMLSCKTGAHLPLSQHGEGTQSLAVICLFDAFLESQLTSEYTEASAPILALEEPEAHLHPSAIRAVGKMLQDLDGQKIISTHSGDLLASVPLTGLRRLCRRNGKICVHRVAPTAFNEDDSRRLDHHIRRHRGNFLFARLWLLVEGETDEFVFQEAARILEYDLFSEGICCFKFTELAVDNFIYLADQLGIDWIVVSDSDPEGQKYADAAKALLGQRVEGEFICRIPHGDMETFLSIEGYGNVFEQTISEQKLKDSPITASKGTPDYWKQVVKLQPRRGKPERAASVIVAMDNAGKTKVPLFLKETIEKAIKRSREAE